MSRASTRRWPDVMIGTLVVLLLGGFGTLLLRPQASAPVSADGSQPATTATSTVPGIPGAPGTTSDDAVAAPVTAAPSTTQPATGTDTGATADAPATPAAETTDAPVIAAAPIGTPDPALTGQPESPTTATPGTEATPAAEQPDAAAPGTPTPRTGGAVPTSEQRTPLRSDYRITLGTFSSVDAAQTAAQGVSALGYTVYPIDLGSQVVAQVGPFADETSAREALADVQRAYPGAVLYPPRNRSLSSAGTPATATPSQKEPAQPEPTPAATPADRTGDTAASPTATSTEPTYLQVGAFDRLESAQNLVQQLRDLGYNPTVNAPAGKKVTVLVGPYTGDPLTRTEARLGQNGLQSFRVR